MGNMNDTNAVHTYEYIGARIQVKEADHEGYKDIEGKVVDETKNTFVILDGEEKTIPKKGNTFKVKTNDRWKTLEGSKLTYRPEDRIKRLG